MYDIITFGSATKDLYIKTKNSKTLVDKKKFMTGKGVCFDLGSKVEIDEMILTSGGGGTNSAATFANQGFNVAYCGSLGKDFAADEIIQELKNLNISTELLSKSEKPTNHSIVISSGATERTILVYRGASETLTKENIAWDKLQTKWFYIAPLSGDLGMVFENLIEYAKTNNIKVALNPGAKQLALPKDILKKYFEKVDILILNQEEASKLTGIEYKKEKEIFKKLDELCKGIAIMTKGNKGVTVSDEKNIYSAPCLKTKVLDKTGAGDSFGSGFVAGYIQAGDIVQAIQLGVANAAGTLEKIGAKTGLLKKGDNFSKVDVKSKPIK